MQLSPRYIHPYTTTAEVPYEVDPSGAPSTGSFGTVQKVTHRQLGGPFAQKTFRDVFSASTRRQILREVGVLEVCRHPNIVEFVEAFEVGDQPGTIHIVMWPWAPLTLLQFLRSHETRRLRCPWARVDCPESRACIYRIMYELADAVGYLHGLSIKHKDIKPDNILLHHGATTQVVPLLADVGVSKVYKPEFETDYLRSSYQYLAPEQLESRESSLKADVWQLGCCFAMIAVVASGGKPGLDRLWTTFEKSESTCLTNICTERGPFMRVKGMRPCGTRSTFSILCRACWIWTRPGGSVSKRCWKNSTSCQGITVPTMEPLGSHSLHRSPQLCMAAD